jgi:hypothetical protein
MSYSHSRHARFALRAIAAVVLTLPLAGAECADLTTPGGSSASSGASYDGTYTLTTVDAKPLPFNIFFVDNQNKLVLTKGEWIVSNGGKSLTTKMWTTSYVSGKATSEARFNPEVHTCSVTISGGTASCTLDSGTSIQATIGSNVVTQTSYGSHVLEFTK